MTVEIALASHEADIAACWPVMRQLRPDISEQAFVPFVRRLAEQQGFELAHLKSGGMVLAVAGLRQGEWLAGGRYLEIEDLVTAEEARGRGWGGQLFDWIAVLAKERGCRHLRLVSRTSREAAHRFYRSKGMTDEALYFSLDL
jgi:ribosomal protein S18 acetylase RimI-like enzyme